jgi:cysteine-rich repeat protein
MFQKLAFLLFVALPSSIWAQSQPTLSINAICGNAIREKREECDDGNQDGGDGCSKFCAIEKSMEPGEVVDVAVGGVFYAPFLGSSISYFYIGDKKTFRKTALIQSSAGLFRLFGFSFLVAGLARDIVAFDNGEDTNFVRTKIGLATFGVGSALTLSLNIKTILDVRDAAEIRDQKIKEYHEDYLEDRKNAQAPTTQP